MRGAASPSAGAMSRDRKWSSTSVDALHAEVSGFPRRARDEAEQTIGDEEPFDAVRVGRQSGAHRAAGPPQPIRRCARPSLAIGERVAEEG